MHYKNWWFSFILGLLMPGFGHIYNGHRKKGVFLTLLFHIFVFFIATVAVTQFRTQGMYLSALGLIMVLWIIITLEGVSEVYGKKVPADHSWLDHWYVILILFLLFRFGLTIPLLSFSEHNLVKFYAIPSESMVGTLRVGDQIMADVRSLKHGYLPHLDDILTFRNIIDKDNHWVKRVVGLPGDLITVEMGEIIRNRVPLVVPEESSPCDNEKLVLCNLSYSYTVPSKGDQFQLDTLTPKEFLFLYRIIKQERRKKLANAELYIFANNMLTASLDLDTIPNRYALELIMRKHKEEWSLSTLRYEPVLFLEDAIPVKQYTLRYDSYFMVGDNRANSNDSRLIGPISHASLSGWVKAIYLSLPRGRMHPLSATFTRTGKPVR